MNESLPILYQRQIDIQRRFFFKRAIDIGISFIGCLTLIPLYLIIKISYILTGDFSKIIFKQTRIGKDGQEFKIYKFRSMVPNAEKELEKILENDEELKKEYMENKKLKNDPRITPIGKIIRKLSIDETPQFINVLKGEMSMVGPRPYLYNEKEDMKEYYNEIIKVKPGLTGLWQIRGRSDLDFSERLKLDTVYIETMTIKTDIKIFFKTINSLINKKGAY